jgi:nicotinamidase-related amidase
MNTALLVMDIQHGVMANFQADPDLLGRIITAADAARGADVPVIFVRVGFHPGFPEVVARNRTFQAIKEGRGGFTDERSYELEPALRRRPDEPVVIKRRVSAFSGTELEMLLRAGGIEHLVLSGVATRGVVLSTLCAAVDLDYRITILADACGELDGEVHRVLTEKVFPHRAAVINVEDWISTFA